MLSIILPVKIPEPYLPILVSEILHLKEMENIIFELHLQYEKGLTNAVVEGVKKSSCPFILVMDADGSHDPKYIPEMYDIINNCHSIFDLVIGSKEDDDTATLRKFISSVYRKLARNLLDLDVKDPMAGFVMGKKEWFEKIQPSMDYKFLLQMLVLKPNYVEYPIHFYKRKEGKSKTNIMTGLRTLGTIIKLRRENRK